MWTSDRFQRKEIQEKPEGVVKVNGKGLFVWKEMRMFLAVGSIVDGDPVYLSANRNSPLEQGDLPTVKVSICQTLSESKPSTRKKIADVLKNECVSSFFSM